MCWITNMLSHLYNGDILQGAMSVCVCVYMCTCVWARLSLQEHLKANNSPLRHLGESW